jgi:hypothetical protein
MTSDRPRRPVVRESSRPKSIRRRLFVGTDRRTMRLPLHGGLEGSLWPAAARGRPARRRMRPGKPESRPKRFVSRSRWRGPASTIRGLPAHEAAPRQCSRVSRGPAFPPQKDPGRAGGFELSAARLKIDPVDRFLSEKAMRARLAWRVVPRASSPRDQVGCVHALAWWLPPPGCCHPPHKGEGDLRRAPVDIAGPRGPRPSTGSG